jgi:hypothetical protein
MNDKDLTIYLWEIAEQCRYATIAWKDIETNNPDTQWYSIQSFLGAIGNVSKLFWPDETGSAQRGEQLRKRLSIREDHPFKSRDMRNALEHSDQRLDDWIASPKRIAHVGRMYVEGDPMIFDDSWFGRFFDRHMGVLTFLGQKYDLSLAAKEAEILGDKAIKEVKEIQKW